MRLRQCRALALLLQPGARLRPKEISATMREAAAGKGRHSVEAVVAHLDPFRRAVSESLALQLTTFHDQADAVLKTERAGEASVQVRKTQLRHLTKTLEQTADDINDSIAELAAL